MHSSIWLWYHDMSIMISSYQLSYYHNSLHLWILDDIYFSIFHQHWYGCFPSPPRRPCKHPPVSDPGASWKRVWLREENDPTCFSMTRMIQNDFDLKQYIFAIVCVQSIKKVCKQTQALSDTLDQSWCIDQSCLALLSTSCHCLLRYESLWHPIECLNLAKYDPNWIQLDPTWQHSRSDSLWLMAYG